MVFFAVLHLATVFFTKAYRSPREVTWLTGVFLLFLSLAFGFSGYLLPWNKLSFFATKVGTDIPGAMPFVGDWIVRFLRGGERVTGGTLSRFYGWHVAILPAITTVLLGAHLLMVQVQGMSKPAWLKEGKEKREMKFFPHFALRDLFGWMVALGVLASLAALFPWELGEKADPFSPAYAGIRPEWYFMFMFETLKLVPGGEIFGLEYEAFPILAFGALGAVLILIPFLDRSKGKSGGGGWMIVGVIASLYAVGMTAWGYRSLAPIGIVLGSAALVYLLSLGTAHRGKSATIPSPGDSLDDDIDGTGSRS
jgi:cytochrome b6